VAVDLRKVSECDDDWIPALRDETAKTLVPELKSGTPCKDVALLNPLQRLNLRYSTRF
jgi:hypothetical protein